MRRIAQIIALLSLSGFPLLETGCGSVPPSTIDVVEGQTLKAGEVLVLGRLTKVNWDGDTVDFGEPRDLNLVLVVHRDVTTLHLMDRDSIDTAIPLRNDGTFFWHLKPGEYTLFGLIHHHAAGYISEYWSPAWTFSLLPTDSAVYIGNLVVTGTSNQVKDDYQSSLQVLRMKFPGIAVRPITRLMQTASPLKRPDQL